MLNIIFQEGIAIIFFVQLQFILFSCETSDHKINYSPIENIAIKGQVFLGEEDTSFLYTPKGLYIKIIHPDLEYWKAHKVFWFDKELKRKEFFEDDEKIRLLYDSLEVGEYKIQYLSYLNDTVEQILFLERPIELEFPSNLKSYYDKISIGRFFRNGYNSKDTIQLLYQQFSCFSFEHKLVEFLPYNNSTIIRVSDWRGEWEYLEIENPLKIFKEFLIQSENLKKTSCTTFDYYTIRKRGNKKIGIIKDSSCEWEGIKLLINQY